MEHSYWYKQETESYPALDRDVSVDTAVIGGGLAGLACAYELLRRGQSVCVLEAATVSSGQTGRSSAFLSFAHDLIYDRLIKKHGLEAARAYLDNSAAGLEKIRAVIRENGIDCGLEESDLFLFTTTAKGEKKLVKEQTAYERLGFAFELTTETELPFPIRRALKIPRQGMLNPYLFLTGLANLVAKLGGAVFERTRVTEQPENGRLNVNGHTVTAKNFIVCTHFPYLNVPGFYFLKLYQHRSHNLVFQGAHKIRNLYEEVEDTGFEYRPVPDGILCGGANIRTGKYKHRSQYRIVEESILQRFPGQSTVLSRFSAQDCMTFDLLPLAGAYGSLKDVYVVTGFNKWGFTNSFATAERIADLTEGKEQDPLYRSRRAYLTASPWETLKNTGTIAGDFAELVLNADSKKLTRIGSGQGAVVRAHGHRLGVYRDEKDHLHVIRAVCPHLGCALKWNKDELSWDCPCHGSRFTVDGVLLDNPALKNAEKWEEP